MEAEVILGFLTIFLVEIIITLDNFLLKKFLLRNFDQRKVITITSRYLFIIIKLSVIYFFYILINDFEYTLNLLGFTISISSIIMMLMGSFLISKTFAEFYTILKTTGKLYLISYNKNDIEPVVKLDNTKKSESSVNIKKNNNIVDVIFSLVLLSLISSIDSAVISLALSDNFYVIIAAIISAQIFRKLFSMKIHKLFFSFLKLIVVVLILNLIIGITFILNSIGLVIDRNILYFIFIFAFMSEAIYYLLIPLNKLIKRYNIN